MKRSGQIVFVAAVAVALASYALTAPRGLPWNGSSHLALAYLGEIARLPVMPHPVWGCYVQVFGGSVALSAFMAALAAGLLAAVVNRYLGWRFAVGAAVAWVFSPWVWNRAVTGQRSLCLMAMAVVAVWALNAVALVVTRKVRDALKAVRKTGGGRIETTLLALDEGVMRIRTSPLAGWVALGAAVLLAIVSATFHDYRLGEAASDYAREVVRQADGRIIVMNGVCDDQIVRELGPGNGERELRVVSLRSDDGNRTNLVPRVLAAFPGETNLWIAARIGALPFAEAAMKAHPERFYAMDGRSETPEGWERRWKAFEPYLGTSDPFARVGRRVFGFEGNGVANATADSRSAWQMYKRIYEEVDPGNVSALVNMSELIRRGYAANASERKTVQRKLDAFFRKSSNRGRIRELVRAAGPVRADPELIEKVSAEAKQRIAEKVSAGEEIKAAPELLALLEWNNEMVKLMDKGELVRAGRIARAILSNPKWQGFIPANAVMGSVAVKEGDYVAGERFLRIATDTTNAVPAAVLNDYADVLLRLGKLGPAEKMARQAVKVAEAKFWVARLTLAEVLIEKSRGKVAERTDGETWGERLGVEDTRGEITALLKIVLTYAPGPMRERIRKRHGEFVR